MVKISPVEQLGPRQNPILPSNSQQAKVMVSKWLLATFLGVNFSVYGNFGFLYAIQKKKNRIIAKCVSILVPLAYMSLILYRIIDIAEIGYGDVGQNMPYYESILDIEVVIWSQAKFYQYIIYVIILMFEKYSLYNFLLDLHAIDENVSLLTNKSFGIICTAYLYGMFILKELVFILCCEKGDAYNDIITRLLDYAIDVSYLCADAVALELFVVYFGVYRIMKRINVLIENSTSNVESVQSRYVALANCFYKIESRYRRLLLIELIFDLPILLGLLWATLAFIKLNVTISIYLASYFYMFHAALQIIVPCWLAHKIKEQINYLKVLLHGRMLQMKEDNPEVVRLLRYLDAHRLEHTLWGVIPVDMQLPAVLFSLCSTYIIIIIQFTHLYD